MVLTAIAVGTLLRLAVVWTDPYADFLDDSAFHWRMIQSVVEHGHVPSPDPLSDPPEGRDVARFLPLGLYYAGAAFHWVMNAFGSRDLRFNVLLFTALAGGLIALPVFAAARTLFAHPWVPGAAAWIAALNPAHLHRTYAFWLRYDALGTLLIVAHMAFALRALTATGRRAWIEGALSGLFLLAAMATWRVALMLPAIELGFVLVWGIARGSSPSLRAWFTLQVGALVVGGAVLSYLRALDFLISPPTLAALLLGVALWTPYARAGRGSMLTRALLLVGAMGAAWGMSRLLAPAGIVSQQFAIIPIRILSSLGFATHPSRWLALQLIVQESAAASPLDLFSPGLLSWSALWFLAAPYFFWRSRRRPAGEAAVLFVFFAAGLTVLTLLFERNKVLLGPVAAIALGGLLGAWLPDGDKKAKGRFSRFVLACALVVSLAVTACHAAIIAVSRRREPDGQLLSALTYLRERTPAGSVVLEPWELGYETQTMAGRAAVCDGLLEVPENQRRIVALARAGFEPTPDSLLALARQTGARYLFTPPSDRLYGLGLIADVPFREKLLRGQPLENEEAQGVLVQMMVAGVSFPGVEKVFESGDYRIYRMPD